MPLGKSGKMKDAVFENIFLDETVLVTGHTGFIGGWLTTWLIYLGSKVVGVSLEPSTKPSLYELNGLKNHIIDYKKDIRNYAEIESIIKEHKPKFIFHLAAQPLVLKSYIEPLETFSTNVIGTAQFPLEYCNSVVQIVNLPLSMKYLLQNQKVLEK